MNEEPKKGGNPSQKGLYAKVAARSNEIIEVLFELLKHNNENVRLGAAKTLINKMLPDLKQTDFKTDGEGIKVFVTIDTKKDELHTTSELPGQTA